ncbi:L,D-transpeptidase family protein [uncultured Tateyamaria sp.]|uniref:L,D-transpeptidase family protein n=1 Tax=uncultured Tateyamaria sp. TaxID=455651 RepID=UPI0026237414|nr:L,D-transpeptidase family protein [uncultured Tateyamaria sp.]
MKRRHLMMGGAAAVGLSACSARDSKFKRYSGPDVTYVVVNKDTRRMFLFNNNRVLKDYEIDLGFEPIGDKFFEGDGRTPEGTYIIDRRNPNSQFYLSLGISYPNSLDLEEAAALGKPPGGDIFIHGNSSPFRRKREDWTWGCIAVTNSEMEDVYAMVRNGTPIKINP